MPPSVPAPAVRAAGRTAAQSPWPPARPTTPGPSNGVEFRVRGVLVATDTTCALLDPGSTPRPSPTALRPGSPPRRSDAAGNICSNSSTYHLRQHRALIVRDRTGRADLRAGVEVRPGPSPHQHHLRRADSAVLSGAGRLRSHFGACSGGTSGHSVSNKPEGEHDFAVKATDGAGNVTEVDRTFAVDATPPDTSVTSGPADGSVLTVRSVAFGFSATEAGSTFQCRLYTAGERRRRSGRVQPHTLAWPTVATGSRSGVWTLPGNIDDSPARRDFTVDATPPDTSLTSGPGDGSMVTAPTVTFGFSATEAGSTFQCRLYPAGTTPTAFAACSGRRPTRRVVWPTAATASRSGPWTRPGTPTRRRPLATSRLTRRRPCWPYLDRMARPSDRGRRRLDHRRVRCHHRPAHGAVFVVAAGSARPSFGACSAGASGHSVSNKPGASYDFVVRATDGAGNVTEVPRTFTIDATAPDTW